MKFSILIAFVLLTFFNINIINAASGGQDLKDIVSKNCDGVSSEGSFLKGFDCDGSKKEIYYIDNVEVTKAYFDTKKNDYYLKGDICTKTEKSKADDLPKGLSYSCTKGEYGTYSINGKKVTFKDFSNAAIDSAFSQLEKESDTKSLAQLNVDKKALKSIKSFTNALITSDEDYTFTMSYKLVGSSCVSSGSLLFGGNGYKNLICKEGKVISMDYYLKNKKVTSNTYIKSIYKDEKKANKKAIATLKKVN